MNRKELQLQNQLDYIRQDSEARRDEILSNAELESEKERNTIIEREAQKLDKEYEKKMKDLEIKQRIAYSQELSQTRLQLLKAEDQQIQALMIEVRNKLKQITQTTEYNEILKKLIIEGINKIQDTNITIRCLQKDIETTKKVINEMKNDHKEMKIELDEMFCLDESAIGGVTVASFGDRIICNNTLEHRMTQALAISLPLIRRVIFPSLVTHTSVA